MPKPGNLPSKAVLRLQQLTLTSWDLHMIHNLLGHTTTQMREVLSPLALHNLEAAKALLDAIAVEVSEKKREAEKDFG